MGFGLDPHIGQVSAVRIQRITQVPACAHVPDGIGGGFPGTGFRCGIRFLRRKTVRDGLRAFLVLLKPKDRPGRQGDHIVLAAAQAADDDRQVRSGKADLGNVGPAVHRDTLLPFLGADDVLVEGEGNREGRFDNPAGPVSRRGGDERRSRDFLRSHLRRLSAGKCEEGEGQDGESESHISLQGSKRSFYIGTKIANPAHNNKYNNVQF